MFLAFDERRVSVCSETIAWTPSFVKLTFSNIFQVIRIERK